MALMRQQVRSRAKLDLQSRGRLGRPRSPARGAATDLRDFELSDAAALATRAKVALKLNRLIAGHGLRQTQAAERLRMPQSKVSAIRNYKLRGISLERLLEALVSLGQHVEITVRERSRHRRAGIEVVR